VGDWSAFVKISSQTIIYSSGHSYHGSKSRAPTCEIFLNPGLVTLEKEAITDNSWKGLRLQNPGIATLKKEVITENGWKGLRLQTPRIVTTMKEEIAETSGKGLWYRLQHSRMVFFLV
jgi:hypothetical protein